MISSGSAYLAKYATCVGDSARAVLSMPTTCFGYHLVYTDDLLIEEPRRRKDPLSGLPDPHEGFELDQYIKSVRKQMMLRALEMTHGNQTRASKLLGVSSQAVQKFVRSQKES